MVLREFLYRRDDLVAQFLEQLEGGQYDEERVREQTGRTTGGSASAKFGPASFGAEHRKDGTSESELTFRQTASSRFNRLHSLLEQNEAVQPLAALDDSIWDQLERNEIIEVDAVLTLLPGVLQMEQVAGFASLLPLIETMKGLPDTFLPDDFDKDEVDKISDQIPIVQDVAAHFAAASVPLTFRPSGATKYTFFAELPREHLVSDIGDLEGEVTVLAKVTRKIEKGKPETMGQPVPGIQLNREQRRKSAEPSPMMVRLVYPAAVVTVIGIYR